MDRIGRDRDTLRTLFHTSIRTVSCLHPSFFEFTMRLPATTPIIVPSFHCILTASLIWPRADARSSWKSSTYYAQHVPACTDRWQPSVVGSCGAAAAFLVRQTLQNRTTSSRTKTTAYKSSKPRRISIGFSLSQPWQKFGKIRSSGCEVW